MSFFGTILRKPRPQLKWKKEVTMEDKCAFFRDPQPTDLIIAIMGATGAGKSTFINSFIGQEVAPVGHSLDSCTAVVSAYPYNDPEFPNNRIVLVDTPGFDDTNLKDHEVLRRISVWLAHSYDEHMKMAGVIYLYNISGPRWEGSTGRNFEVFEKLCGQVAARKVVLVTTRWDSLLPEDLRKGEMREQQLKEKYWKPMIDLGSDVRQGSRSRDVIQDILDLLLVKQGKYPLHIQKELGELNKTLAATDAVRHLSARLEALLHTREELEPQLHSSSGPGIHQRVLENDDQIKSVVQEIFDKIRERVSSKLLWIFGGV